MSEKTIFERIIDREIPADIVYEDEHCIAFRDIRPQAPTHVLLVPKRCIPAVEDLTEQDQAVMGHLWLALRTMAKQLGLEKGYRVVLNNGRQAGQEVPHLHFHVLSGRGFGWPPG